MRALLLLTAILGAGCAGQATDPRAASSAGPLALTDAQTIAGRQKSQSQNSRQGRPATFLSIEFRHGFPHPAGHHLLYR